VVLKFKGMENQAPGDEGWGLDNVKVSVTPPPVTLPVVSTNLPSVVTATTAKLSGTVNPKGAVTTASFDFGTTTSYGTNLVATPATIAATAGATAVSADKTGLNPVTTYHYRVKAVNSAGTTLGADKTFTTTAPAGSVRLDNGVTLTNQTVNFEAWKYYYIAVPTGATNLVFTTSDNSTGAPSGDIDIYTQLNVLPTDANFLCTSFNVGNAETCTHAAPSAGTWWLGVFGYDDNSVYTVTASFLQPQTISAITATPAAIFVGNTAALSATASSGLTVAFSSTTPSVCNVNANTVTGLAAGTCTVAADQAGNTTFAAAGTVTKNLTVSQKSQTIGAITFAPTTLSYGGTTNASATASSGLAVTFGSTTPNVCSVATILSTATTVD
jgi:hypothetical protein